MIVDILVNGVKIGETDSDSITMKMEHLYKTVIRKAHYPDAIDADFEEIKEEPKQLTEVKENEQID